MPNRVVIIKETGTVNVDGVSRDGLDLSSCNLPNNLWALQWGERGAQKGHIEYDSPHIQNEEITVLPQWANNCVVVLQTKLNQETEETQQIP